MKRILLSWLLAALATSSARAETPAPVGKSKAVRFAPLKMIAMLPPDCSGGDLGGSFPVTCTSMRDANLTVSEYSTTEGGHPVDLDAAFAEMKRLGSHSGAVTETGRSGSAKGEWQVTVKVSPQEGRAHFMFQQKRVLGKRALLCQGTSFDERDVSKQQAICGALRSM